MPPPTLPPPKPADTRLISITSLKPLPVTPPPPNKKLKPLGSLVPPPIPGPSRRPASEMKTIFTTNVALATDIRTERGQAEVLALYLQQYGTGFVDPTERELQRGLETSPEKLSKRTKHAKFARCVATPVVRLAVDLCFGCGVVEEAWLIERGHCSSSGRRVCRSGKSPSSLSSKPSGVPDPTCVSVSSPSCTPQLTLTTSAPRTRLVWRACGARSCLSSGRRRCYSS